MKNLFKTMLLAATLLVFTNTIKAQDKYDYATVTYYLSTGRYIGVSINGTEFKRVEVLKEDLRDYTDMSALLKVLKEMNDQGWELVTANAFSTNNYSVLYLQRKRTN